VIDASADSRDRQVAMLASRVDELSERQAVLDLFHRYGASIDYGDYDTWVDCFTPDGVFDVRFRGHQLQPVRRGAHELREYIEAHGHIPQNWHKHLVLDSQVTFAGGTTTADSYFARLDWDGDYPYIKAFGRYRDTLQRDDDGRWRFVERVVEVEGRSHGTTTG
jgi:hypothetical protein